ncbi:MAG: bifunctional phosphopantothenoylcysteine decarboxylase/phosphopantothenate--cysteine ligase CoaBC [Gemmatimonadota bacterium]|nr:bifunctional phosphopantothenoylcysteine decarboxylase/phosphopantothenate--cysteine ligase CoaBC [Gemmatimonadota bacterium]
MRPFDGSRVLLVVTGGIAAYKSVILMRRLIEHGAEVDVVMTEAAEQMVGAVTFSALSGRPVKRSLWEEPLAHIDLGRDADAIVVAPATANIIAKLANGLADDLASATLLAAEAPILVAPAMNTRMWENPATQANVEALSSAGLVLVGPASGPLAEGESGPGRMEEPETILAHLGRLLEQNSVLRGQRVVVTAGPTLAPLDPVRFVGNRSSGRMGFALAASAWRRGADVVLVCGPTRVDPPVGPRVVRVEKAEEMLDALRAELDGTAVLVMAAAVADFRSESPRTGKLKKENLAGIDIRLTAGPDLLAETLKQRRAASVFTLGFALETEDGPANASRKLHDKGMDMVALNPAGEPDSGFDVVTNRVTIIDRNGLVEELPLLAKHEVADRLLDRVEERLGGGAE